MTDRNAETLACLQEIGDVFNDDNDMKVIERIHQKMATTRADYEEQEREIKRSIKNLSSRVDRGDEKLKRMENRDKSEARVAQLDEERVALEDRTASKESRIGKMEEQLESLMRKEQNLLEKERALEEDEAHDIPIHERIINLYISISNIQWDYESKKTKGRIVRPDDIKKFELDPRKGDFVVANQLWDLLAY